MFIERGWGARLREEREKLGLPQEALANRNTQRAYETEANAPNVRYLESIESRGMDVLYILAGRRELDASEPDLSELLALWASISTEFRAGLLIVARGLVRPAGAPVETSVSTVHSARSIYRAED